jgi:hypothetical protein
MSYSDEPNVISEQTRSKKMYFLIGGLLLFMALLASVAFFPRFLEFQRHNTPVGPHGGSVYFIKFEGNRYSMELARPEVPLDFHMGIVLQPTRERTAWQPEEYHVRLRMEEREEVEVLAWNPEMNLFGPSELRFHPAGDWRFEIEVNRGESTVWSGRRWSFRMPQGHGH